MKNKITYTLIVLVITLACFPGQSSAQFKTANKLYSQLKYNQAIPYFLKSTNGKKEAERKEATWKLAECYRLINNPKEASVWYKNAVENDDVPSDIYLNYGIVLRTLEKYEKAKNYFTIYLKDKSNDVQGEKYMQFCNKIQDWLELESSAKIENYIILNSRFSDFSPVFYKQSLVFISDRDIDLMDNHNYMWTGNGYLNLYYKKYGDTTPEQETSFPVKMSKAFNQNYHDGPVCFTNDEKQIFTTRTLNSKWKRKDSIQTHYTGIYHARLDTDKITYKPFEYNDVAYSVAHPALTPDGKQMIFSSNMPGGSGKSDLYYTEWIDGKWAEPVNLGKQINTFGNEYFPYLANASTLYFSSDGHMGYGGLDIYVSHYKNGKWQQPQNVKAPINSSYDDFGILFTNDNTKGFFSSNRPGGDGADDIYKFQNFKFIADPKN